MTALINNGDVRLVIEPSAVLALVSLDAGKVRQRGGSPNDVNVANVRVACLSPSVGIRVRSARNVVHDNTFGGRTIRPTPVVVSATRQQDDKDNGETHEIDGSTLR